MKQLTVLALAILVAVPALAAKPCEELKSEIAAKLDAKGVKGFALEITEPDKTGEARVVGSCDGGAKKIIYTRS